jgi:hypothetical protein
MTDILLPAIIPDEKRLSYSTDESDNNLTTFETKIAAMTREELGLKCRENGLKLVVKRNPTPFYQQVLIEAYTKYCADIKGLKLEELREICRDHKIPGFSNLKKDELINTILALTASCSKVQFINVVDKTPISNQIISELELMKKQLDERLHNEREKLNKEKPLPTTILKTLLSAKPVLKTKPVLTPAVPAVLLSPAITVDDDQAKKKKKQTIPKSVKTHVWDLYIGKHINEHRCLCCKKAYIQITNFDTGHVLSEKDGGTHEISNLRPICAVCNHSMGSENMIEFVKRYGYYIG